MATPDDDTTTQTAPPPPAAPPATGAPSTGAPDVWSQIMQLAQQITPQPVQVDTTPVKRSFLSLLGEAAGGGKTIPMSPADEQRAGLRALGDFGTSLMAASHYQPGQTVFSNLAQGFQGAERSMTGSEQMAAGYLGAQQNYQQQQLQNRLEALKQSIPLLTLKTQIDQAAAARGLAGGGGTPGSGGGGAPGDGTYESTIAGHEGLTADANLPSTVGGFRPDTWQGFVKANPTLFTGMSPEQALAARSDPKLNAAGITWLAQQNAPVLTKGGAPVNGQSLGIAHYLGAGPAAAVMGAPDNAPVSSFVGAAAVKANPELATMTVGQMKARYAGVPNPGFLTPPGATRTAGGPPTPTTPPAASTAPPGVQMGGTPPAPPGGSAGPYAGGGFGAALGGPAAPTTPTAPTTAPANTPEQIRAIAIAQAKDSGQPVPIHGMQGMVAYPNGNIGPPPGGGLGRGGQVSGDVGAMQAGRRIAATTPADGTLAAGPAARPTTAPSTPWPATTTTIGNYNDTPATAPPTVTPPAVTPPAVTPPTTTPQPPPPSPYPDIKAGDVTIRHPGSFADYRAKEYVPPTGEDFNPNLTPAQNAAFAARQQDLQLKGQQLATLPFAEQPKAAADLTAQRAALEADRQNAAQAKAQAAAAATTKYNETQQKDIQTRYDAQAAAYNTAAGNEQTTQGKLRELAQQGEQAQTLARINAGTELEKGDADQGRKDIEGLNTNAMAASNMQSLLGMIGPQLKDLPSATVGAMLQDHPGAIPFLTKLHLLDGPTANATQLLQGLTAFMATEMKPKGLGPLRIQEMNAFQGALPNLLQSDEGRQKAFAFMNAYTQRIMDEADFSQKYFMRDKPNQAPNAPPGSTVPARNTYGMWSTIGKPVDQGGLGSVLPMYTGGTSTLDDGNKYATWERQQQSKPGNAYWQLRRNPNTGVREMHLAVTPPAGGS